ncbi:MAG: hypothetical protein P8Y93_07585 [Acidobacteriota bacterium]
MKRARVVDPGAIPDDYCAIETFVCLIKYLASLFLLITMYAVAIPVGLVSRSAAWVILVAWGRFFLKIFGVEVDVEYEDPRLDPLSERVGGVVVGLTQQSLLDPIIGQILLEGNGL